MHMGKVNKQWKNRKSLVVLEYIRLDIIMAVKYMWIFSPALKINASIS